MLDLVDAAIVDNLAPFKIHPIGIFKRRVAGNSEFVRTLGPERVGQDEIL